MFNEGASASEATKIYMLASRLLPPRWTPSIAPLALKTYFQSLHKPGSNTSTTSIRKIRGKPHIKSNTQSALAPKEHKTVEPSLFEELFPDEAAKEKAARLPSNGKETLPLPRLRPVQLEEEEQNEKDRSFPSKRKSDQKANPFEIDLVAVIIIEALSTSLSESDFRRIAPKGQHIKDWTGPGDIVKVIPARDPTTLVQLPYYFLVFRNIANAMLYRKHVLRIHRAAQEYTPTSVESPFLLPPGRRMRGSSDTEVVKSRNSSNNQEDPEQEGERKEDRSEKESTTDDEFDDLAQLLKDYALCPPSQQLKMKLFRTPVTGAIRKVVENGGYVPITRWGPDEEDRTGRAVLFWVDASGSPSTDMVQLALQADGRERGLWWECNVERFEPASKDSSGGAGDAGRGGDLEGELGEENVRPDSKTELKGRVRKWILTFAEQEDARRFVGRWQQKVFPMGRSGDTTRARAEILW